MTVSQLRLRVPKSETREIAEREMARIRRAELEDWGVSNSTLFAVFVVIAAVIAIAALVLR
jgi:hypothetical protein